MSRIHRLDGFTINQIAAGEVVERPASVVKELIENSIDAESTAITIEIENGGISYIRVTDNGYGMSSEDAVVCFERHATSKIMEVTDLYSINTLGFRGEALASIASVSQAEMYTRRPEQLSGYHIINNGGQIISAKEAGCPEGTTVIIKNLFYNTPARLKFLKSNRSEAAKISELILKLILAHPEISFKYINQDKTIYHSPGDSNLLSAIAAVYGRNALNSLIAIEKETDDKAISLHGFIGEPSLSRTNRNHQSFFINGRYIKDLGISNCLHEAYKTQIMVNHYPWAVLHLSMPANEIDVNVHPSKTEIRFKDADYMHRLLFDWFKGAVSIKDNYIFGNTETAITPPEDELKTEQLTYRSIAIEDVPVNIKENNCNTVDNKYSEVSNNHTEVSNNFTDDNKHYTEESNYYSEKSSNYIEDSNNHTEANEIDKKPKKVYIPQKIEEPQQNNNKSMRKSIFDNNIDNFDELSIKIIGSVYATYIIIEMDDCLYILDQHAAHERLLYEKYSEMIENQETASQQLKPPFVLEVTHDEFIRVTDNIDVFYRTGFEIEEFGGKAFLIRSVPLMIKDINIKEFFNELLDRIENKESITRKDLLMEDIIMLSCKSAVKANQELKHSEIISLLKSLTAKAIPMTCPHGRPIFFTISKYELEKRFKRIQ